MVLMFEFLLLVVFVVLVVLLFAVLVALLLPVLHYFGYKTLIFIQCGPNFYKILDEKNENVAKYTFNLILY